MYTTLYFNNCLEEQTVFSGLPLFISVLHHQGLKNITECKWQINIKDNVEIILLVISPVQFSSVAQSRPTLYDPMNCSTPGLPVHHQLPEFTQTHVHRVSEAIQPSHPLSSPSPAPNPSQHQSFPMSQLFSWGGRSIGVSASASVLPMNIQHWFPLKCKVDFF